jgi:hypothetical protein
MPGFNEIKNVIVSATGLSRDTLHIYVGLTTLLLAASILRKPLQSVAPWLAVLIIAIVLELPDMRDDFAVLGYWQWRGSLRDVVNTLVWPTVLMFFARRGMFTGMHN